MQLFRLTWALLASKTSAQPQLSRHQAQDTARVEATRTLSQSMRILARIHLINSLIFFAPFNLYSNCFAVSKALYPWKHVLMKDSNQHRTTQLICPTLRPKDLRWVSLFTPTKYNETGLFCLTPQHQGWYSQGASWCTPPCTEDIESYGSRWNLWKIFFSFLAMQSCRRDLSCLTSDWTLAFGIGSTES